MGSLLGMVRSFVRPYPGLFLNPDLMRAWALKIAYVARDPRERIAEWIETHA